MKETKLLGKEASSEEEKTKMEQIKEEVQNSIFSVYYLLLKNQETSLWKFIILLTIEYLQLLSFSFDASMAQQWKADEIIHFVSEVLDTFRVIYWIEKLQLDIYIIIFYICVFLVFLVVIDFLYVAISYKHKRFSFMQPIQILRIASTLLMTILFIPIIEIFLSLSACKQYDGQGLRHVVYEELICFQSIHILHITISYLMIIIYGIMVILSILLHYENRFNKDPTAKANARTDLFHLLARSVYAFIFTFFPQNDFCLFKSVLLCIFSSIVFLSYIHNKPYFNKTTQKISEIYSGIFAWTNYVLLFTQVIQGTQFNGAVEIFLLGIPIICVLIYTRQEDRLELLMASEAQIQKGELCQKKNFFYLHIIESKDVDRYSAIILKGYINHHSEICLAESCPIKAFKKQLQKERLNLESEKKKKSLQQKIVNNSENNQLLLAQAKALYLNGIKRFPKYNGLRIDFANFLQSRMKDRKGALNELTLAEKSRPGLDHQFMIFRLRKLIEDELAEGQEHGGVDFIAAINFENQLKLFKQLIEKSAMLHYEFWNHLLDESPDLVRLSQQGSKINASILTVEDHWKKLAKMSTNTPKALKLYASFQIEILNDKETGNEQMFKAKEAANLRVNFEFNNVNEDYSDLNNYAQDGTPCIYISGETEKLGLINQCNMSLCKIFGFNKKDDLITKDVEMLMPRTYFENHKEFLTVSGQKSADQISSRERQVFGKHLSGYVFPLWLQIKNLPSLLSGRQYVATFKVEKTGINKNVCHLLLTKNKEIADITPQCLKMLGISYEKLNKRIIYYDAQSMMPQLFSASSSQYSNKAGSIINFYMPKIEENKEQRKNSQEFNHEERHSGEQERRDQDNDEVSQVDKNSQDGEDADDTQNPRTKGNDRKKLNRNTNDGDDDQHAKNEDDYQAYQYKYKAIGNDEKVVQFQCNLTEIQFELIGISNGYHLRLESLSEKQNAIQILKKVKQPVFQFSYDPLFKRFVRELRDLENKDFLLDKNYLELKLIKERIKNNDIQEDPNILRYQNMSYIIFLNKKQRAIQKELRGEGEDDDENPSEDESQNSDNSPQNLTKPNAPKDILKQSGGNFGFQANASLAGLTQKAQSAASNLMAANQASNGMSNQIDYNKMMIAAEGYGKDFLKSEIERLIKLLQTKQTVGVGVHTFIRQEPPKKGWEENNNQHAGLFSDRGAEIQKIEEEEEEQDAKEKDSDKEGDQIKASIKSKKAFSIAINDKTMPSSIKRLSTMAQIILLFLIALAIAEYSILYKQYQDTEQNFKIIQKSYERTAEISKVVYNARTMILINQNLEKSYGDYRSMADFISYLKDEFSNSLDLIYSLQNEINLSQLPLSSEQDQLLNNKTVVLYFKQDSSQAQGMKALNFSLTEAILQISSTIFTISNLQIQNFNETNEDVFFLMYNSFNEFYQGLTRSSTLYVQEMKDRADTKTEICLILYILSIIAIVICLLILFPVVHSVNQQKDKVLSLFCEIDNGAIRILALRCERFINNMQAEEGNDDIDSNEDIEDNMAQEEEEEYSLLSGNGKRIKKPKGRTKTDKTFFLKFLLALLFINAYYMQNLLLQRQQVETTNILNNELNVTSITEPFYWFSINAQREMIFNPNKSVINQNSLQVNEENIYKLYDLNNQLQETHLNDQTQLSSDYWNQFDDYMRNDICSHLTYYQNQTLFVNGTDSCEQLVSGTLTQGLHVILVRYFDTLRNNLDLYQVYLQSGNLTKARSMFQLESFYELCKAFQSFLIFHLIDIIQNHVTQKLMRNLVSTLSNQIQLVYSNTIERKIALFIVFLIVLLISFIVFWLPFLNGLNYQIYKTKLMLMIIPLEILMKIKNVGKVLQSQSFLQGSKKRKDQADEKLQ